MTKKIHYCRCKINLAGQNCHTVIFDQHNPVTWPEVQVLMMLHNEENVMDIMPVGIGEVWPTAEKNRLIGIYGHKVVETCFPGRNFRMDYMMTDDEDLPLYVDGVLAAGPPKPPGEEPKPVVEPAPTPIPMPAPTPEPDEDEEGEIGDEHAKAALPPLDPIFKRGRGRPHVGP